MTEPQIARIRARIENEGVVLASKDPNLEQDSDGTWVFTILKGTSPEVVFAVDDGDAKTNAVARSALRVAGDTWGEWVVWKGEGPCTSPSFVHENEFRLELSIEDGTTGRAYGGGGFFRIRDQGGGRGF